MLQRRKTRLFQQPHTLIGMSDRRTPVTIHGRILPEIFVSSRPGRQNSGRRTLISMPDRTIHMHPARRTQTIPEHIQHIIQKRPLPGTPWHRHRNLIIRGHTGRTGRPTGKTVCRYGTGSGAGNRKNRLVRIGTGIGTRSRKRKPVPENRAVGPLPENRIRTVLNTERYITQIRRKRSDTIQPALRILPGLRLRERLPHQILWWIAHET